MNLLVVWDWKGGADGRQILRFCFQIVNECNLTGKAKVVDNLNGLVGSRSINTSLYQGIRVMGFEGQLIAQPFADVILSCPEKGQIFDTYQGA